MLNSAYFTVFFYMADQKINPNKIVLFAKCPGQTSFSSLYTIKHAFNTQKVGHTGTLDSFASGLLVVCCGALTRLAGRITEFDKTYEAVIKFGEETDTLECTGKIIKTAELPDVKKLKQALSAFTGNIMQKPPAFSAIHIDGKRASDLVRSGKSADIPARPVTVFSCELLETKLTESDKVLAARIKFSVSKGTYIRSLARDIGEYCGSAAYLVGLLRTKVGNFELKNAAGFNLLENFTIDTAFENAKKTIEIERINEENKKNHVKEKHVVTEEELLLQKNVVDSAVEMNKQLASLCGFASLTIKEDKMPLFYNGGKLHSDWFDLSPFSIKEKFAAVFAENNSFAGLLEKDENGYFKYSFVVH